MKIIYAVVFENGKRIRRAIALRKRRCKICGQSFQPQKQATNVCGLRCGKKLEYSKNKVYYQEQGKKYYSANIEKIKVKRKKYYWSDPERFRSKAKQWSEQNFDRKHKRDSKYKDVVRHGNKRKKLLEKSPHCADCGKDTRNGWRDSIAHHETFDSSEHEFQVILCRSCHMKRHRHAT